MRLAVTGFVSERAGSVASANALLLRGLLDRGFDITFFSKASFVDPRPSVGTRPGFHFVNTDNRRTDWLRRQWERAPGIGFLARIADAALYNRLLVQTIARAHERRAFDLCVWLGDWARGSVAGLPMMSFAQGAPGTDARSLIRHYPEIARLAGRTTAWKWRILARARLSRLGLPPLRHSQRIIVGSRQSKDVLHHQFGIPEARIAFLPYPIDLDLFDLGGRETRRGADSRLRCLWLGRIIPRKRLDLFLDGLAGAIRRGIDLEGTIVGGVGFVPGYEKLIAAFPYPERLQWIPSLPREDIPALLRGHDVLIQPSEEENFGSSVAEAQACGLPVIVGRTNGNADYLCDRDIHLPDDRPESLAEALGVLAGRKNVGAWGDPAESRACAERHFAVDVVVEELARLLVAQGVG